jgi:sugar fermentation stimulation protein A
MKYHHATFIRRLNRFVAEVRFRGADTKIFVPNTGRLAELLIPGTDVYLVESPGKYPFKMQIIMHKGKPVMIDSIYSNSVFAKLIAEEKVPALTSFRVNKREPSYGHHRFDFLLKDDSDRELLVELKSCTLARNSVASFPDAVSERASNHVRALAESKKGMLIFFLLHQGIKTFVPNFHTDFQFYRTVMEEKNSLPILAYSAVYDSNFKITGVSDVDVIYPEEKPKGSYCIILKNEKDSIIPVGSLGDISFKKGFYVYAGSAMNNVFKRIERHKRKRKTRRWHLDYIRSEMQVIGDCPVISAEIQECLLADFLDHLSDGFIKGFGSSDCGCASHLFYFEKNPLQMEQFWEKILSMRYGRFDR